MRIAVAGAMGRMGSETVRTVMAAEDMELCGAFDRTEFKGMECGGGGVVVTDSVADAVRGADCLVDFTNASVSASVIREAIVSGVSCVSGTTGHSAEDLDSLSALAMERGVRVLVVPNFSIGAVLMMRFAAEASKYFEAAEIIELHHERKLDSPSGTSVRTLEGMLSNRPSFMECGGPVEVMRNARGAERGGVHVHSVRLPGLVAHQEVLFGSAGEYLTIRHDSTSRVSFMSGVLMALRNLDRLGPGLSVGLEKVMGEA